MTATTETSIDGRVLRGQRNREAIVDALLHLYGEGHRRPTAAMVADQAGLSTRSVYHHFDDMKSLILEVSQRSTSLWQEATQPPEPSIPLEQRVRDFAEHRFTRWAISAPVVRAGLVAESRSSTVARLMQDGRRSDRHEIATAFAVELSAVSSCEETLAGLDVAYDFSTWERLHVWSGLGRDATVDVCATIALALLD